MKSSILGLNKLSDDDDDDDGGGGGDAAGGDGVDDIS